MKFVHDERLGLVSFTSFTEFENFTGSTKTGRHVAKEVAGRLKLEPEF